MILNQLGHTPTGARLARCKASPNYPQNCFCNLESTPVMLKEFTAVKMLKMLFNRPKTLKPAQAVPALRTNMQNLPDKGALVVWFGHSSYFLKLNGFTVLVDPVFSGHASPVPFMMRAFEGADLYKPNDMPVIDLLVLTHDHYDHLDASALQQLAPQVKAVVTALGVGAHLEQWGLFAGKLTELDWWQTHQTSAFTITATPARHFSGRSIKRYKTLWASFVLECGGRKLFLGGDSGYGLHFKEIGERFGPFDLALLECGQYGDYWPYIHMLPEETVQAAKDLGAKVLMPVHWAKFALANHPWNEPAQRVTAAAAAADQAIVLPQIGEVYTLGERFKQTTWWNIE